MEGLVAQQTPPWVTINERKNEGFFFLPVYIQDEVTVAFLLAVRMIGN